MYCNRLCCHAAGNRSACNGWNCGCTGYSKKRRLLRAHREQMRVMEDFIDSHGLLDEFEETLLEETGDTGFWLGDDDEAGGMDEPDDSPDPEQELRQALSEREGFIQAAKEMMDSRVVVTDLERSRMQLEDFRSQGLR